MSEQNGTSSVDKTAVEGAPEVGAFSMYDMSNPFDDDPEFPEDGSSATSSLDGSDSIAGEGSSAEAKDGKDAEAGDTTDEVEINGENVSRETLSELLSLQKEALEDEVLKPWLTGEDSVSLIELARIGASQTSLFEKAVTDRDASMALVGEILAIHFKNHGDEGEGEDLADENALDVLHTIKNPNTLDPAARPFYEAAKSIAGHARQLSQIGKDLAQELEAANKRIAEYEQGPELLKVLHAKVPDAEISAAELKRIMDTTGTKSPVVAYKTYLAEQEEKNEAKGVRQAEPKTPNQPKSSGVQKTFVDTGDPDTNFELAAKGYVMVNKQ